MPHAIRDTGASFEALHTPPMRAITPTMLEDDSRPAPALLSGPPAIRRLVPWLLGVLLVGTVVWVGSPALDAPWIQGDEHIFIVKNPDVTGTGPSEPTGTRWLDIFLHAHEDLYQPITILSYALEWSLWGDNRVYHMRLTDVLIHALNTLLLWAVLRALLRRLCPGSEVGLTTTSWALACVWALHPMLVGAYVADMGRTHLLAATFTFLSLLMHVRSLEAGRWRWFLAAYVALLLAMLNKPMVGWVIVVFVLEWVLVGLRRTLRSARIYLVGGMCVTFALLTLWTTRETLLIEDSPLPLFGDPLARAALGLWIYLRNFVAPLWWLSAWYPPDIRTGWDYPLVWLGVLMTVIGGVVALLAARRAATRGVSVGLVWFWAMWLPVSGLVGARVLAAQDRYMYQPAVGLLLAFGVGVLHWVTRGREAARRRALVAVSLAVLLGAAAVPWDLKLSRHARSTIQRAQRAAKLNPEDPRVTEFLAAAYDFSRDHDTLEAHLPDHPDFLGEMHAALLRAAELAEQNPHYFGDDHARAAFHRRLSYNLWGIGRYEESLAQAQRAHDFEPEAKLTWVRLAHAYRALDRWEDARRAYEKLAQVMAEDAPDYALRYTEFADLLLHRFNDPSEALYKYRQALLSPTLTPEAQHVAMLGAARCEVLAGQGSDGFELAQDILQVDPNNLEAWKIMALYHLRSHDQSQPTSPHLEQAEQIYREILQRHPTEYEALRGFQNVCVISGKWRDAAFAWQDAREVEPGNLIFRAHFVWAAACAGEEPAGEWADELLEVSPNERFACLARMLLAIRSDQPEEALQWVRRAAQGPRLPQARELVRAEFSLRKMIERGELPPEAVLLRAALWAELGRADQQRELLRQCLETAPAGRWRELAEGMLASDQRARTAP